MAIVQISRITQRKGLQVDLPQLAGAEFGWSIDERRLFIGNGTLEEGAPVIGNTEILTEFSDILAFQTNYTYKGTAATGYTVQTGPTVGTPVSQSLQNWLDQYATVKDFGATGDGETDDTDAINRALNQLYCQQTNTQIRRSLFFPAGVYRVTSSILIPPYAMLYGEGVDSSIIRLDDSTDDSTLNAYVARTVDSLQQYGVNIGTNGATEPQYITIANLAFENLDPTTEVFLLEDAIDCRFDNVGFYGSLTTADLTSGSASTSCLSVSTQLRSTSNIKLDGCEFSGCTYGFNTVEQAKAITVSNSTFNTLYKGVVLGVGAATGPTGFRVMGSAFDTIYAEGIVFGNVQLNASGYNVFYDVANHFDGVSNPATYNINIQSDNNISVGDMFERNDAQATNIPRIYLNGTSSVGMTNSKQLSLGNYTIENGVEATLTNNFTLATITTIDATAVPAFCVNYTILRSSSRRTGTIMVSNQVSGPNPVYSDDYVENASTGIALTFTQTGTTTSFKYTATNTGVDAILTYTITRLV